MLDTYLAFFQRAVDSKLKDERFGFKLFFACQFLGALGKDVIKPLFEAFSLDSLPFLVVGVAEKNCVFGGNYRRSLWQQDHFTLHYFFDGAGNLDDEFLCLAARLDLRVSRRLLEHELGRFAVDPTSYFFENAQVTSIS